MAEGKKVRPWCGHFQWPGKVEFLAGTVTVVLPADAPHHEVLAAVEAEFIRFWQEILPDHYDRPKCIGLIQGSIFFSDNTEE